MHVHVHCTKRFAKIFAKEFAENPIWILICRRGTKTRGRLGGILWLGRTKEALNCHRDDVDKNDDDDDNDEVDVDDGGEKGYEDINHDDSDYNLNDIFILGLDRTGQRGRTALSCHFDDDEDDGDYKDIDDDDDDDDDSDRI